MVINYSKEGKKIADITKIVVPVNKRTVRAYEIISSRSNQERGKK